jgi:formiminotetrahydrofolate cyclodeaminase
VDLPTFITALAQRTPTPGGGAAAAVAAALGCAAGAMAARYTTGAKWAAVSDQAQAFAELLDRSATDCLRLADEDAAAYAAVGAARKAGSGVAEAEARAAAIPVDLLGLCTLHANALADFIARCNPNLVSDVKVGIHLLAGAGRAAWQTLLVNRPGDEMKRDAQVMLDALTKAEAMALAP